MKIAFLADPLSGFKIYKDTTFAMMREAAGRGHTLYAFEHRHIAFSGGAVVADVTPVTLTGNEEKGAAWYTADAPRSMALNEFDVVVERTDPPFDMEYIYATYLLELAQNQGARVVNRPEAVRSNNEKLSIMEFPQFTPPTLVTSDAARIRAFHAEHRDIILKPLDGMGGAGIFRITAEGMNLGSVIESLSDNGRRTIMVQRYVPDIVKGDKRVLLIDGKVVPFCLARIPQNGEVRGNLAAGGIGVAQPITEHDRKIAETLGPILAARGLLLVGLDVIGENLTEINVTSPTCFQEIAQQTGFNVAAMFVDALEAGYGAGASLTPAGGARA
jgi:glutathione synthase